MTLEEFLYQFNRSLEQRNIKKRQFQKLQAVYKAYLKIMAINPDKAQAHDYFSIAATEAKLFTFRNLLKDSQTPKYKSSTIKSYEAVIRRQFARFYQNKLEAGVRIKGLSFPDALRELRTLRGLTQEQVVQEANRLGIDISIDSYKRIESGKQWPDSINQLNAIIDGVQGHETGLKEKCPQFVLFKSQRIIKSRSELIVNFSYVDKPSNRQPVPIDLELKEYGDFKRAAPEDLADKNLQRSRGGRHHKDTATNNKIDLLRRYIGFLTKISIFDESGNHVSTFKRSHVEKINSGLGLDIQTLTLKDLHNLEYLKSYREFVKCRNVETDAGTKAESKKKNNSEATGTIKNLVETLADISAPVGYLVQHKSINRLYSEIPDDNWAKEISQTNKVVTSYLDSIREVTNDSARIDYLKKILMSDRPIKALIDVIKGLERDIRLLAPENLADFLKDSSSLVEIDQLSLPDEFIDLCIAQTFYAIELATPLRIGQLNSLSFEDIYEPSNKDDHYKVTLYRKAFKNSRNTRVHRKEALTLSLRHLDIDENFDLDITPILDRYLRLVRPYVSAHWKGKHASDRQNHLFVKPLDRAILSDVAECYGPMRFTPHCCRHIMATDVIKTTFFIQHLDGFQAAAQLLLDSPRTVEKTYADFGPENYQTYRHTGIEKHRKLLADNQLLAKPLPIKKIKGSNTRADLAEINSNPEWIDMSDHDLAEYLNYCGYDRQRIGRIRVMIRMIKAKRRKNAA